MPRGIPLVRGEVQGGLKCSQTLVPPHRDRESVFVKILKLELKYLSFQSCVWTCIFVSESDIWKFDPKSMVKYLVKLFFLLILLLNVKTIAAFTVCQFLKCDYVILYHLWDCTGNVFVLKISSFLDQHLVWGWGLFLLIQFFLEISKLNI